MPTALFYQFAVSSVMVVFCVVVHGIGLFGLTKALRSEINVERLRHIKPLSPRGALFTLSIVVAIIGLHGLEIWAFAVAYLAVGAVQGLEAALYFSTISYSTVGYSDVHILHEWRLIGAFESILGMLLLGWSTSFFFRMLGRIDAH
ncbi:two pore domain potassium channel family protein [Novosphingobium sp. FSY-8]|uniref:Two pore domain potassium channel family protein n=1 Tax=Novosphingobium ovatum TaxID=1908523 RepID=A0ABW9XH36_9SPHN|nr:ion channel [Novosphingobium ovatum]NBC37863.1 two pore domain potassium channel family protein [Novosphingobium ovatum]